MLFDCDVDCSYGIGWLADFACILPFIGIVVSISKSREIIYNFIIVHNYTFTYSIICLFDPLVTQAKPVDKFVLLQLNLLHLKR